MQKLILIILINAIIFSTSFGQDKSTKDLINLNKLLSQEYSQDFDIGYLAINPQFEENQDPNREVSIEIFYGEIDDSEQSKRRIEWLKYQLLQDQRVEQNFRSEILAYGPNGTDVSKDARAKEFIKSIKLQNTKVRFDSIPENLKISDGLIKTTSLDQKDKSRAPAALSGRTFWTMVRTSAITTGTSCGVYFSTNIDPTIAFSVGLAAGLTSGGITYFSASYGKFLTSGAWATWLLESDTTFATGLRKSFGINGKSIATLLDKQQKVLLKRHPELAKHPEIFEKKVVEETIEKFNQNVAFRKNLTRVLGKGEEYLKWWITEVLFTIFSLNVPQSLAGIGTHSSVTQMVADSLVAGTYGFLAQGPADIAIQVRKYQMVEELREGIKAGKVIVENKADLLVEIDKVLAKEGQHANYVINDGSHSALKRIENWSRSRATMLSFFSVLGVGLKVAKIPLSDPLLYTVGVGGAFYYIKVQGLYKKAFEFTKDRLKYLEKFEKGLATLKPFYIRYCGNFFRPKI